MTQEDRDEMGAIVRQSLSANIEVTFEALRAAQAHMERRFEAIERRLDHLTERRTDSARSC